MSADLTVVLASPAQKRAWRRNAWEYWMKPGGMSEESFHENQDWQESEARHAQDDRALIWALVPRSDLQTTNVLAACRTLRRQARCYDVESGQMQDVTSYCVTGVITAPEHRRKGYARQLMSTMHYILGPHDHLPPWPIEALGPPPGTSTMRNDALYSILWSDVGVDFYRSCKIGDRDGWVTRLDEELVWDIKNEDQQERDAVVGLDLSGVRFLREWNAELVPPALVDSYETKLLKQAAGNLDQNESELTTKKTKFILDSANSPGLINYYLVRGVQNRSSSSKSKSAIPKPETETFGFVDQERGIWAVWLVDLSEDGTKATFRVTSVGVLSLDEEEAKLGDDLARLKAILLSQAKNMGCDEVTLWALPERIQKLWMESEPTIKSVKRKEHLGAIAWYGTGHGDEVQWEGGQEFTWA